jgi:hypothetical protein
VPINLEPAVPGGEHPKPACSKAFVGRLLAWCHHPGWTPGVSICAFSQQGCVRELSSQFDHYLKEGFPKEFPAVSCWVWGTRLFLLSKYRRYQFSLIAFAFSLKSLFDLINFIFFRQGPTI